MQQIPNLFGVLLQGKDVDIEMLAQLFPLKRIKDILIR